MATILQFRRGTANQHTNFIGAAGEITFSTDQNTLYVHDGSTQGGFRIARHSDISLLASNTYVNTQLDLKANTTYVNTQLDLKANSSYVTSLVASEISSLVDAAPGALDTLNELAAAIGDDANFVTTINDNLDTKAANSYVNSTFASNTYVNTTVANYLTVANSFSSLVTSANNSDVTTVLKSLTNNDRVVANPDGFLRVTIDGTDYKIPYFS